MSRRAWQSGGRKGTGIGPFDPTEKELSVNRLPRRLLAEPRGGRSVSVLSVLGESNRN